MLRLGISGFGCELSGSGLPAAAFGRGLQGFQGACDRLCLLLHGESNPAAASALMWTDPCAPAAGPTPRSPVLLSCPLEPTKCSTGPWPL